MTEEFKVGDWVCWSRYVNRGPNHISRIKKITLLYPGEILKYTVERISEFDTIVYASQIKRKATSGEIAYWVLTR